MSVKGFFLSAELLDPDFDEDLGTSALWQHEIETGAMALHPDGDRRNPQAPDPIPLHCRGFGEDDRLAGLKIDWDRYLNDRVRWEQEAAQREARWQEQYEERLKEQAAKPKPPPLSPASPLPPYSNPRAGWNYNGKRPAAQCDEHGELLFNMRLEEPLGRGQGRVWKDYVMIRVQDFKEWQANRKRSQMPEVCRGHGFIIFRRLSGSASPAPLRVVQGGRSSA
jgi:hypothetical protein